MANAFNTFPTRAAEKRLAQKKANLFPALEALDRDEKRRKKQACEYSSRDVWELKQALGAAAFEAETGTITLPSLPRIYGGEPVTFTPREGHLRVGGKPVRATRR